MDLQKTGKFIAEARKMKNLTQSQLGEMLGISGKAISKWERGINAPDVSILMELATILDVSVSEILKGEKIKSITSNTANEITVSTISMYDKIFKRKYLRITLISAALLLLLTLLFSATYLITNYNKCFVYQLSSGHNDAKLKGLVALNQKENSLMITDIRLDDNDTLKIIETEKIEISLLINKNEIFKQERNIEYHTLADASKNFGSIQVSENSKITKDLFNNKNIDKLKLVIRYKTNEKEEKIILPIKVDEKFSNNKILY